MLSILFPLDPTIKSLAWLNQQFWRFFHVNSALECSPEFKLSLYVLCKTTPWPKYCACLSSRINKHQMKQQFLRQSRTILAPGGLNVTQTMLLLEENYREGVCSMKALGKKR